MAEEYTAILTRFNISPTAAKVYIALLELGTSTADKIAKRVGTYKANVYDALDRLMEAGLATSVVEGRKKMYLPTNPEKLVSVADEAKQKMAERCDELKKDIENIMPQLSAKYNSIKEKDVFEVYKGRKGYRAMILDILREKPACWNGFGNLQVQEYFPYDFPKWFKNVHIKLFATKTDVFLKRLKKARKATDIDVVFLPEELYMPIVWTLFGDNLLILLYAPDIIALRIKSEQIVKTFSGQFAYLWNKHKQLA